VVVDGAVVVTSDVVLGGAVVAVVVGGGVVVVGGGVVVVGAGGCVVFVDGGGGGGITVTVGLLFGPVTVTVCDVCGGAGWFAGALLVWPKVSANTTATSTATAAPTTLKTSAVRLYQGSRAACAPSRSSSA
jgi:hypothetical protein